MKNKLLRLFLLICAVFIGLIGITKVNAESYNGEIIEGEWISGVFVRMFCGERFSGRTALETGRSARSDESGSIAENQGGI